MGKVFIGILSIMVAGQILAHMLPAKKMFLVKYTEGVKWDPRAPYKKQIKIGDHIIYLKSLYHDGHIELGASLSESNMGLYILRSESLEKANRLLSKDPAVQSGLLGFSIKPMYITMKGKPIPHVH
ncbi:MAG: hypothetical protein HRU19_28130 [Pseudobacteriovorax sp.]|nr:hypothetical protein [Pseudobacteriovorax sp.]